MAGAAWERKGSVEAYVVTRVTAVQHSVEDVDDAPVNFESQDSGPRGDEDAMYRLGSDELDGDGPVVDALADGPVVDTPVADGGLVVDAPVDSGLVADGSAVDGGLVVDAPVDSGLVADGSAVDGKEASAVHWVLIMEQTRVPRNGGEFVEVGVGPSQREHFLMMLGFPGLQGGHLLAAFLALLVHFLGGIVHLQGACQAMANQEQHSLVAECLYFSQGNYHIHDRNW